MKIHPLVYKKKGESSKQISLDTLIKPKYCSDARSKEITEMIVQMIVLDIRPIRMYS